jgi:hypothetical protein
MILRLRRNFCCTAHAFRIGKLTGIYRLGGLPARSFRRPDITLGPSVKDKALNSLLVLLTLLGFLRQALFSPSQFE